MICAVVVAAVLAVPSREALIERWLHANRTHARSTLESPSRSAAPPDDLRALAQRELGVPGRYQLNPRAATVATEPWWARVWDWVKDRWSELWRAVSKRVHVSPSAASRTGDALLALVAFILILVVIPILRGIQFARSAGRLRAEPLAAAPDPQALYRAACQAANRGEYGGAALLLFAATVALLETRGAVAARRSATVGDLRRELRAGDAALIAPFDAVAAAFVQRAYADRTIDAPQWQRAQRGFEDLFRHPEPVEG